jgi:hypothetical protein
MQIIGREASFPPGQVQTRQPEVLAAKAQAEQHGMNHQGQQQRNADSPGFIRKICIRFQIETTIQSMREFPG